MKRTHMVPLIVLMSLGVCMPALNAQVPMVRALVEEATEQIFKSASREGLEQIAEMGGKAAVREVLEQSSREGGEQLVKRVAQYGVEEGPMALRAIRLSPAKMVESLDGLTPELRTAGLRALDRNPQAVGALVKQYGSGALEAAARHPGVGEKLVGTLGSDGVALGRSLTTDQSIIAARYAEDIAKLAPAERSSIVGKILKSPVPVLNYLETHPRILLTATGVALVMAVKDDVIGRPGNTITRPDGTVVTTPARPGLIERILPQTLQGASPQLSILAWALAAGVLGWFAVHLLGKWRAQKT